MTIKKRLTLAFALMIIIPMITGGFLGRLLFSNSMDELEETSMAVEAAIKYEKSLKTGKSDNWKSLSEEFPQIGILINYENGNSYTSLNLLEKTEKHRRILNRKNNYHNCKLGIPFYEGVFYSNSQRTKGTYTLYYNPSHNMKDHRILGLVYFSLFLLIVIITDMLLSLVLHRSLVKPFKLLDASARLMAEGNLDMPVVINNKDEIGELSKTFDQMRQRLKESLQQQQEYEVKRKELIASISHDLRTPLSAIKGYVEGLRDGIAETPQKKEKYLNIILQKTKDLDYLIEKLFLFSKMERDGKNIEPEPTNIIMFLKDYLEERQEDYPSMKISFKAPENKNYSVLLDKASFRRALSNIVDNAYFYNSKENKELRVSLYADNNNLCIRFSDNGDGIPEKDLSLIFEQFYRVDKARSSGNGHSGLGLSISKMIIESHGGTITASSTIDKGTTIEMLFLRRKDD